jgi:hypothetical protein
LIAWALLDLLLGLEPSNPYFDALLNGAIIGVCVGVLTGGFGGLVERRLGRLLRGLMAGLITGLLGGAMGLLVGEALFQAFGQVTPVRAIGWAILGIAIGAGEGLLLRSWRRMLFGLFGGLVGGVLGSLAFIMVRQALAMPGFSRALGFTILGALIGLFIGLVPVVVGTFIGKLRVISAGRNEGKEILLDKDVIQIGRDDRCDLGLYGDKSIQPRHAEIRRDKQGYLIQALVGVPLQVNGQPVQSHRLQKGDRVGIGREVIVVQ